MVKLNNGSRLKETNFSEHNLRASYVDSQVEYLASLRDSVIFDNWGIKVHVRVPANDFGEVFDNNVNEYNNFVNEEWIDTTETVVPLFKEYREVLSEAGMTADGTDAVWPLEVIIPSKLHIPRDSRIVFNEYDCEEQGISREWVVLGTVMKQLSGSKTYSRIARCVPSRQVLVNKATVCSGTFIISGKAGKLVVDDNVRAQGTFVTEHIPVSGFRIYSVLDESGYDESTGGEEIVTNAKKLVPYEGDMCLRCKRVSASVLF